MTDLCQCCKVNKLTPSRKKLNNALICYRCKMRYKEGWLSIIFDCKKELKAVYVNSLELLSKKSENQTDLEHQTVKIKEYSKVILKFMDQDQLCLKFEKNCRFGDAGHVTKEKGKQKGAKAKDQICKWCIFKKVLFLVKKMTCFKLNNNDADAHLKDFYKCNEFICQNVIEELDLGKDNLQKNEQSLPSPSSSEENDKCRSVEIIPLNQTKLQTHTETLSKTLFKMFKQFHQDDINSCNYLIEMFESLNSLAKKSENYRSSMMSTDSIEIVALTQAEPFSIGKSMLDRKEQADNISDWLPYWSAVDAIKMDDNLHSGSPHSFLKNNMNDHLPLKKYQKYRLFIKVLMSLVFDCVPETLLRGNRGNCDSFMNSNEFSDPSSELGLPQNQINFLCIYREGINMVMKCVYENTKYTAAGNNDIILNEAKKSIPNEYFKMMMEYYKKLKLQLITLQFLWSYDHRYERFYLNENVYFSLNTLKRKIEFYFAKKLDATHITSSSSTFDTKETLQALKESKKFIQNLQFISKNLSSKPKFLLIIITLTYILKHHTEFYRELCSNLTFDKFMKTPPLVYLREYSEKAEVTLISLYQILTYFEMYDIYKIMHNFVDDAGNMELFLLSSSNAENVEWQKAFERSFFMKLY